MRLDIGKEVFAALSGVAPTYPVIAEEQARYPFIVYRRTNASGYAAKCRPNNVEYGVEVVVVSDKYTESVEKAESAITEMFSIAGKQSQATGRTVSEVELAGASESYADEAYFQMLSFIITAN